MQHPTLMRSAGANLVRKHVLAHVGIIALAALMIYPPLWMFSSAFKPSQLIFSEPGLWPREITLENWAQGWVALGIPFSRFFLNSAVIAALSVIGNLFSCSLAAYAFARLEFRLKPILFALMLATIMLPCQVVLVPQYILFHELGWTNTVLPLVVPKFLAVDAFFGFLLARPPAAAPVAPAQRLGAPFARTETGSCQVGNYRHRQVKALGWACRRGGQRSLQPNVDAYVTVTPRSASNSSTSRRLRWKRKYSQTAWLMISTG